MTPATKPYAGGDLGYPPQSLREYALLADGYRGALIGPRGDVVWLCAPRWDSPAVFSSLIGGRGLFAVTPVERFVWGGYYEPGTLIWRSRWVTTSSTIECREALAFPGDPRRLILLRRIEAIDQEAVVDLVLDVRADFGRQPSQLHRDDADNWSIEAGELHCRFSGADAVKPDRDGILRCRITVSPNAYRDLVLEISDRKLPDPIDPAAAWLTTEQRWEQAVPRFSGSAAPRDTRHAYTVLRGLTAPGGGMVAAPTLGLPERARQGRNFDYRYVWLRDQAYAGIAAALHEPLPLLDDVVAFTTARVLEHGDRIAPAYRIDGRLPPQERTLDLPGYPGGQVVVGNWVRGQFQLDCLGEMLQLYATSGRHDRLTEDDRQAIEILVETIEGRWRAPDAGIWELEDDWWTHSRLSCVAGLRSAARHVRPVDPARLLRLADEIMAETSRRCLSPTGGWQQTPDRARVDAALLLPGVRGALSPTDPRSLATLDAVCDELVDDGYVFRYAVDSKPLGQAEGAFLMCGFAVCLAQLETGRTVEAFRWFERQRAACGPAGLLAEEFDVRQRQLRGNLPQGFVHALLLECSQRLGDAYEAQQAAGRAERGGTDQTSAFDQTVEPR